MPVAQLSPEPGRSQTIPQVPQFVRLVSEVSQPSAATPLQSPKPGAHAPSVHVPDEQLSAAFGRLHETPQPPQFVRVLSAVSQPVLSMPSQFPAPLLHERIAQLPVAHVAVAPAREQGTSHPPQLVSVRMERSQPSDAVPLQSSYPELQETTSHEPVAQLSLAFASAQLVPQPPQFTSVVSDVSQPFELVPSQLPKPAEHDPSVQVPAGQLSLALSSAHATPQPPQLVSVASEASQPFMSVPSQLPDPPLHERIEHEPAAHVAVAPGREQGTPQPPQSVSERSDVSQPFESVESQSS